MRQVPRRSAAASSARRASTQWSLRLPAGRSARRSSARARSDASSPRSSGERTSPRSVVGRGAAERGGANREHAGEAARGLAHAQHAAEHEELPEPHVAGEAREMLTQGGYLQPPRGPRPEV